MLLVIDIPEFCDIEIDSKSDNIQYSDSLDDSNLKFIEEVESQVYLSKV